MMLSIDPTFSVPMRDIEAYLSTQTTCTHRILDERTIEVWGDDLREHYLVTLKLQQNRFVDIVSLGAADSPVF